MALFPLFFLPPATVRFRKKAIKFEEITLGDKIDLINLERRCASDRDDAAATEREDSAVVRRRGSNVRVVKRSASLRALRERARREAASSRPSGDKGGEEYQPALPPPRVGDSDVATVHASAAHAHAAPRAKKRAQLLSVSTRDGASSGQLSPSVRALLIGDDGAPYEGSDVELDVEGCPDRVTVCGALAELLKEHQLEGLKFCWRNVCSKIMSLEQEGIDDIHGAILAHNMVGCTS